MQRQQKRRAMHYMFDKKLEVAKYLGVPFSEVNLPYKEWMKLLRKYEAGELKPRRNPRFSEEAVRKQVETETEDSPVDVVFRVWETGEVLALFSGIPTDERGFLCESYLHIGQHGSADFGHCVQYSRLAKPSEYADLKKELERIGYKLNVVKKETPRHRYLRKLRAKKWWGPTRNNPRRTRRTRSSSPRRTDDRRGRQKRHNPETTYYDPEKVVDVSDLFPDATIAERKGVNTLILRKLKHPVTTLDGTKGIWELQHRWHRSPYADCFSVLGQDITYWAEGEIDLKKSLFDQFHLF
jgi:hypothetical protein